MRQRKEQRTTNAAAALVAPSQAATNTFPTRGVRTSGRLVGHAQRASPAHSKQQSSPVERPASSGVIPPLRGSSKEWTAEEVALLTRLVTRNKVNDRVNWVLVLKEWQSSIGPYGRRSKAALTTKWRTINMIVPLASNTCGVEGVTGGLNSSEETSNTENPLTVPTTTAGQATPTPSGEEQRSVDPEREDNPLRNEVETLFCKNLRLSRIRRNSDVKPRRINSNRAHQVLSLVDKCIERHLNAIPNVDWDTLTKTVYAGAVTVTQLANRENQVKSREVRTWFEKTKDKMSELRKIIGKATAELERRKSGIAPTAKQIRNLRALRRDRKAETCDELKSLIEQLKMQLQLLQTRVKAREEELSVRKLRKQFETCGISRMAKSKQNESKSGPPLGEVRKFWKSIVGLNKPFQPNDEDLLDWAKSLERADNSAFTESWMDFSAILKKAKSWKAPGPDGIHAFWWKVFKQAGKCLYILAFSHISEGKKLPSWLTNGRVVLIYKSGLPEHPANYRPIACLNTSYKLITALLAAHLSKQAELHNVLPTEQIAIRKGTWGCTHAALLDQAVVADATNQKQKPLHVAWIDYAKAFDSVPHKYMSWTLKSMGVDPKVQQFINSLFDSWTVQYEALSPTGELTRSKPLRVKSGVLQGDSFSPLMFCFAMAPISHAINKLMLGYTSSAGGRSASSKFSLTHQFYMDDLKIYSDSAPNLEKVLSKVDSVSRSISMRVNAAKCARASHIPKRMLDSENTCDAESEVPDIRNLAIGETYKYLGIEQRMGIKPNEAWDRAKRKFLAALEHIWMLDLTFRQKINATNAITPILTYVVRNSFKGGGTYRSTLRRGDELDKAVRGLLVRLNAKYKANAVNRMYLPPSLGGWGLLSVRDSLTEATIYSWAYVCTRPELSKQLALFQSLANRDKRCVLSDASTALEETGCNVSANSSESKVLFGNIEYQDARELARAVVSAMRQSRNTQRFSAWKSLVGAGQVLNSSIELDASFYWLKVGKMSSTVVRNALAVQEGCLLTRASPGSTTRVKTCRKCTANWETPEHVVSCCSAWLTTLYIYRHDLVAQRVHYRMCRMAGLTAPHYSQSVPSVMTNDRYKLCWNQPIQCNAIVKHNKPDIVLYDNQHKRAIVVEVAVSWHTRIEQQRQLKLARYTVNGNEDGTTQNRGDCIRSELTSQGWKVEFIPVVIGTCGEVSKSLAAELANIGMGAKDIQDCTEHMSRSAVLGTNRIVKNHLSC